MRTLRPWEVNSTAQSQAAGEQKKKKGKKKKTNLNMQAKSQSWRSKKCTYFSNSMNFWGVGGLKMII